MSDAFLCRGSNLRVKKLWENANPANSFSRQTIAVNTTGYDLLFYVFSRGAGKNPQLSEISKPGNDVQISFYYGDDKIGAHRRTSQGEDTSKVVFEDAQYNGTVNNTYLIPIAIYGLAGVE